MPHRWNALWWRFMYHPQLIDESCVRCRIAYFQQTSLNHSIWPRGAASNVENVREQIMIIMKVAIENSILFHSILGCPSPAPLSLSVVRNAHAEHCQSSLVNLTTYRTVS